MGLADGGCGNVPPRLRVGTDADLRLPAYPKQVEPKHRFTEHVGEVELEATTEAGIFEAGLLAFTELLAMDEQGESVRHEVELAAPNRAAATLSNLEFRREGGIWHGRIVLDV